jgi:myo-inositol-1(or 4)-monophosphatase
VEGRGGGWLAGDAMAREHGGDRVNGQGTTGEDPRALLSLAERAARAAGEELLRRYGVVRGLETKSSDTDPVSDADRASERLLTSVLLGARPDDGILGEEGTSRPSRSGLTWVVDPLDGTVNYLYQVGSWSVSVAADDEQGTVVGVVHDPVAGRTFTAVRGAGAWLNGSPIRVNDPVEVGRALLATGFAYVPERRARQADLVAALLRHVRDIRRIGSAALDLCFVGAGMVDAYHEEHTNHWDVAAGGLVAREAGAVVTRATPTGGSEGVLAAGPALHADLVDLLGTLAPRVSSGCP